MSLRWITRTAQAIGLLACFALAGAVAIPAALGYERYVITSGSMAGTYDRGSIVYAEKVPTEDLRVDDVITYSPPERYGDGGPLTHRIAWIGRDRAGHRVFRTKGDANPVADPWRFTLDRATEPRVAFSIPYAGYAVSLLAIREARMLAIGLPALAIAFAILAGLWRSAGAEVRRREATAPLGEG